MKATAFRKYTFNLWDSEKGKFSINASAKNHIDAIEQADNWARITRENTGANVWPLNVKLGWKK